MINRRFLENILFYFIGFFVVSIFLVIAFVFASRNLEASMKAEIDTELNAGIARLESLNERMKIIDNVIIQDSDFNTLVYQRQDSESLVGSLKSMNILYRNLCFIASDVSYIFTLFANSNIFLSSSDISLSFDDYFGKFMSVTYNGKQIENADEFKALIYSQLRNGTTRLHVDEIAYYSSNGYTRQKDAIIVLQSTSDSSSTPLFVSMFVITEDNIISTLLRDELAEISSVRILSKDEEALVNTFGEDYYESNYYIFNRENDSLRLSITIAIPLDYYNGQLGAIKSILAIVITLGIITSILFTLFYGLKRYKGFSQLISAFDSNGKDSKHINSFVDIQNQILGLKITGENYKSEAEELTRRNQAIQFQNIITKGIKSEEDRTLLEAAVPFASSGCLVSILKVLKGNIEEAGISFYEELARKFPSIVSIHSSDKEEIYIIPIIPDWKARLTNLTKDFLEERQGGIIHISFSEEGLDCDELPDLYEKAERALVSLYMYDNESMMIFYQEDMRASLIETFSIESLQKLKNLLLISQEKETIAILEDIFHKADIFPLEAEIRKKEIYYSLFNVYQDVCQNLKLDVNIERLSNTMTIKDIKEIFIKATTELCNQTSRTRKSHNKELLDNILRRINDEYSSPELSAYIISKEVGITEKYLLIFFREQMGTSFPQYLMVKRLLKAKELLEETDYSNEQIANLTGFIALNTFYRNFSKYFGITPKAYKDGLKNNNEHN